jgi:hypothetical protein
MIFSEEEFVEPELEFKIQIGPIIFRERIALALSR